MSAQKIRFFLSASPRLMQWSKQTHRLNDLQQSLQQVLPSQLLGAYRAGALKERQLIIYAINGAVAAKLKQQLPTLLKKLRQRGFDTTAIQVKVHVTPPFAGRKHIKHTAISQAARTGLAHLASDLPDSPLKLALSRLLRRHRSDSAS